MIKGDREIVGYDGGKFRLGQEMLLLVSSTLGGYPGNTLPENRIRAEILINRIGDRGPDYGITHHIYDDIMASLSKRDPIDPVVVRAKIADHLSTPDQSLQALLESPAGYNPQERLALLGYKLAKEALDKPFYNLDEIPESARGITRFGSASDYETDRKTLDEEMITWFQTPLGA